MSTVKSAISISCVISNFNYQHYVGQAIDSALSQSPGFARVVVVNDGSSDQSLDVLRAYGERITLIDIPNSGQTAACLCGFAETRTDYVYFLDADDFLRQGFLQTILPILAKLPVKLQFQLQTVSASTGAVYGPFPTYSDRYGSAAMIADNRTLGFYRSPPTSGNIFRSDFLRSIDTAQLDPRGAIDGTLNLVAPYFGEVVSLNTSLAFRRVHENSFGQWSRPTPALLQKELDIFQRTWREATALLDWPEPPFGNAKPVYVLERELVFNALSGRFWLGRFVAAFVNRILRSREPAKQRFLLTLWALALLVPSQALRDRAIQARRSPIHRPALLDKIIRVVTRR